MRFFIANVSAYNILSIRDELKYFLIGTNSNLNF
jgi:hypothetical protein